MTDYFASKWYTMGWQGLTLSIPDEWNIGAIGGENKQGYLRIDGVDMPRVEIKWADAGQNFVDIPNLVGKYLKDLQKGKKSQRPEVDREIKLVSKRKLKNKKGLECFAWKSETQHFGAAWFCPDCQRTVIMQVSGHDDEPVQRLAERVILSTEDHPAGDWVYWSTYGFQCETPKDFALAGQKLMAGLIELDFSRENEKLHVARWGMANVALRHKSLEEWGRKELGKRLKKFLNTHEAAEYFGHQDLVIEGRSVLPQEKVGAFVQHCLGKVFPDRVRAHLWHCEDSNRLLYVEGILDREHLGLVDEVQEHMVCHGETSGEDAE